MKTVTYRPQANLTERVNRNLVQMIACFVEENHENWDRFLHEFVFALRTSVNETTNKTPTEFSGSGEESKGRKSHTNKGNAVWEDSRLKRKVGSNGSRDMKDLKRSKICRRRSLQWSKRRDQKRLTPEEKQGIKRAIPSSIPSRNYKYRRPNNPSQGSQSFAGPSHLRNARQGKPPTEGSKHDMTGQ
ncbi:uncharacterized protein TNCV_1880051 [Trichonephila clavipes]|nr:uncharacterized protein TNCV_1880051 [Trichonephila clavipes]